MNDEQLRLQKELEELEKRISKNQSSGVSEEQVVSIVENETSSMQEEISTLSLNVEQTQQQVATASETLEQVQTDLNQTKTIINNTAEDLENLQATTAENFNHFSEMFANLSDIAYSGSYNDLVDIPTEKSLTSGTGAENNKEFFILPVNRNVPSLTKIPIEIFLICEPGHYVSGEIDMISAIVSSIIYCMSGTLYLNDEEIIAEAGTTNINCTYQLKMHTHFYFTFMPKKSVNKLTIYVKGNNTSAYVHNLVFNFKEGKNLMIINDSNLNQTFVFDDFAVCGRMTYTYDYCTYLQYFSPQFDNPDEISYSVYSNEQPLGANKVFYDIDTNSIANIGTPPNNFFRIDKYVDFSTVATTIQFNNNNYFSCVSPTYFKNDAIECKKNYPYLNLGLWQLITEFRYKPVYFKMTSTSINDLCLLSQPLPENTFVSIQAVMPTYSEDLPNDEFYGYIIVRKDGNCYYFPDCDSNYYIKLGVGRRPMGYYRNGEITIFLGGNNFCTRLELRKNSSGIWVVVNRYAYKGIDNLRLINNDKYLLVTKNHYVHFDKKEKYYPETKNIDNITYSTIETDSETETQTQSETQVAQTMSLRSPTTLSTTEYLSMQDEYTEWEDDLETK